MNKIKKYIIVMMFMVGFLIIINSKDVKAYSCNISTNPVSYYTGVEATWYGYYGQVVYFNIWDPERSNTLKSGSITVYKNGSPVSINMSQSYFSVTNYCNWANIPMIFYQPGEYTFTINGTQTNGTYNGSGSFYIYDITPVISSHPANKSVKEGTSVTFSTSVSSGTNVTYQWFYNTTGSNTSGNKIAGATSSSYTIPSSAVTSSLNGRYYFCYIKNDCREGKAYTTNTAKLTLLYEVKYDANGGTGAPSTQTKTHGTALTLSSTKPTRSGYTFIGWSTSSTAASAEYLPGNSYTSNSGATLYAVWIKNPAATMTLGTTYSTTISTAGNFVYYKFVPSSAGSYTFATSGTQDTYGYLYDVKMEQLSYNDDGGDNSNCKVTYTLTSGNTYYYKVKLYNSEKTGSFSTSIGKTDYTVSYNANGGNGSMASTSMTYGVSSKLLTNTFTRSGYMFKGWSTSSGSTSATYSDGASVLNLKATGGTITLYAVWEQIKYTITYNANGGSGAPSAQTKYYGTTLTLSSTKPTRSGHTFKGWSTSSTATSATYQPGGSYTSNSSATLYAVWKINKYTVSYNANGGTGEPSSQIKTYGITLELSSTKPTRIGHTFKGWSTSSTATSATYQPGESYTSNSSATLYAVWEPIKYTITYNANGGSGAPLAQTKYYGTTLTLRSTKPTRSGYTFSGWSTSSTETIAAVYQPGESYTSNSSTTLYAVWEKGKNTNGNTVKKKSTLDVGKTAVSLEGSKSYIIKAKTNSNGKIKYDSSNTKVATVNNSGTITIKSYGTVSIKVSVPKTDKYEAISKTVKLTIKPKKQKVKVSFLNSENKVKIQWEKDSRADKYQIQISDDKKFKKNTRQQEVSRNKISTSFGAVRGRTYYIRVRSYKKTGGKYYYGKWSGVKAVKIK